MSSLHTFVESPLPATGSSDLRGETTAAEIATLLRDPTVLSTANAAEVMDQLVRVYGRDADDVHADLALLASAGMEIVPITDSLGFHAGRLRARYYHRQRMPVSLADCMAAATALNRRKPLATSDPTLAQLIWAESGNVHGLQLATLHVRHFRCSTTCSRRTKGPR